MQLDSSTLIFSIGILSLLMAFISWTFPGPIAERDYGLKTWSIGITFVGISLILIFLRGFLPPFGGVFMVNICLMAGDTLGLLAPARSPAPRRRLYSKLFRMLMQLSTVPSIRGATASWRTPKTHPQSPSYEYH